MKVEAEDQRVPSDLEWTERTEGARTEYVVAPPRLSALPFLVFAGLWDSFLVFFYVAIHRSAQAPGLVLVFPILHGLVGAYVTWLALGKTLNRSRITVDHDSFVIGHGPIVAPGVRLATPDIERFEAREAKSRRGSSTWKVRVVASANSEVAGKAVTIALPIDERDHVAFLVSKLNAALATARAVTRGESCATPRAR